jgi:hypothetical protein
MLFNKLIRIDLIFLAAVFLLNFMKTGGLKDALFGFAAILLLYSIIKHVRHYKSYKKFY